MKTTWRRRLLASCIAIAAGWTTLHGVAQEIQHLPPVEEQVEDVEKRVRELEARLGEQQLQYEALRREFEGQPRTMNTAFEMNRDAAASLNEAPQGYEVGSDTAMTAQWKDGLEFSTKNKDFRVHIGGRTQVDLGWFSVDPNLYTPTGAPTSGLGNTYADGVDFRRARLRIDGTMYETMEWAVEYDFVNSANFAGSTRTVTAATDLWWMFKEVPFFQNIKIGNQKEAIGFEHMVSSRFQPFMERSYNQDAFFGGVFNGFTPGIAALGTFGDDEMATYNIGIFKPTNNVFAYNTGDGDYAATARLTRLLIYEDDGAQLLHVGGSFRQGTAVGNNVGGGAVSGSRFQQFRTRDAIRTGLSGNWPTPANITLAGDDQQTANAELVAVHGSWTFQSEYLVNGLQNARSTTIGLGPGGGTQTGTIVNGPDVGTAIYHGGYVQVLYFLTGEHDHYEKKNGFFGRVRPHENAFWVRDEDGCSCHGWGAWQVGARYNYLDLNDKGLNGGQLHNITTGVNWFLNPNSKLQFDYIATYRDAALPAAGGIADPGDGWIHGWGMRFAHDF
ncbi:MAG TPA: porin [Pirellulaceae bacterium]|nr:porin [Pirellulaceae bacterium]